MSGSPKSQATSPTSDKREREWENLGNYRTPSTGVSSERGALSETEKVNPWIQSVPRVQKPSTGVSSEIERGTAQTFESPMQNDASALKGLADEQERRRVVAYLDGLLASLRSLREDQKFWLGLGPAFRCRYEDFQGDLAMLKAAYRE